MSESLVIGDVHGCAEELRELADRVPGADLVLVGDLFTKGPDPLGVLRFVRERGVRAVLGNHDARLLRILTGERCGDPHGERVIMALDAEDRAWRTWLRDLPLHLQVGRYLVTHAALHPSGDLDKTDRYTHINRRRWPDDEDPTAPFWWQVYEGPPVIFGHDAARGLVLRQRGGAPWIVGLDTGCVYGGELSGFLVGEGRVIQVKAKRAYKEIGGPPGGGA